jgi:hypothetical protein
VIEGDDEGILIDQAFVKIGRGSLDRERSITPGTVGENDSTESPRLGEFGKVEITSDMRVRDIVNAGLAQLRGDGLVFLAAQGRCQRGSPSSILPNGRGFCSKTTTVAPFEASRSATSAPAVAPPMTATQ